METGNKWKPEVDKKKYSRDIISNTLLLSSCFGRLRDVMYPHLASQIVTGHLTLLQILDHSFAGFLQIRKIHLGLTFCLFLLFYPIYLSLPFRYVNTYRVFHRFRQAKFYNGGSILSSRQFSLLPRPP
jgi:hypothetical protein